MLATACASYPCGLLTGAGCPTFVHRLTDHSDNYQKESFTVRYSSRSKNNYFAEMRSGSEEGV